MRFEIVNPSDPYTMEADDLQIAVVAVSLLGDGKYPLKGLGEDAGQDVPFFAFGGADEWFLEKFGMNYETTATHALEHRHDDLAKAFESVTLGRSKRSSMNDIGGRAKAIAQAIRQKATAVSQPDPALPA